MTIKKLIEVLSKYDPDLEVLAWNEHDGNYSNCISIIHSNYELFDSGVMVEGISFAGDSEE